MGVPIRSASLRGWTCQTRDNVAPFLRSRAYGQRLELFRTPNRLNSCRNNKKCISRRYRLECVAHDVSQTHSHVHNNTAHCHNHHHNEGDGLFDHSHSHDIGPDNWIALGLRDALNRIGVLRLASYLDHSPLSAVLKIVFFSAASIFHFMYTQNSLGQNALFMKKMSIVATSAVYVFAGIPAAVSLVLDVASLKVDTHVLMNLAVIGTLIAGLPLEGALLLVLFQTSHALEHMLTDRAQGSLKALFDAIPDHADIVGLKDDGAPDMSCIRHLSASEVHVGDVMLVKPGSQVPLDGDIVYGQALVSAEHITGESIPILRRPGDALAAGSLCHDGVLCVRASRTSDDSTPARIARLARDAQAKRPRIRTWLDMFGEVYSKTVIGAAFVSFVVMVAIGIPVIGSHEIKGALYRSMGLLTVASPCALVMVPMAYVSAIAALAAKGILLKGGRVLDAAQSCRIIAMDKTGTLTTGSLEVKEIQMILRDSYMNWNDVLGVAKALSMRSSHPVSNAVISESTRRGLDTVDLHVQDFVLVPGGGVSGVVTLENGTAVSASFGSIDFVSEALDQDSIRTLQETLQSKGVVNSIVSILVLVRAEGQTSATIFVCEDSLRGASLHAVQSLQKGTWVNGKWTTPGAECEVVMLTGDNEASASKIAKRVGIDRIHSGLTPEEKLALVKELGKKKSQDTKNGSKSCVLMIGDGLNDAAALAAARVGVAIASPTTAAASLASDVVVMNYSSGVSSVPLLLRVSRETQRIIKQNLILAAGSIVVLALPTVLGFLPLWLAVMFHEGSTLLVALNSLRLLTYR